jgi:hypothetical protein
MSKSSTRSFLTYRLIAAIFLANCLWGANLFAQVPRFDWAFGIGTTTANNNGNSVAIDANGNVYVAGSFQGTSDFDPGSGTSNFVSQGSFDAFIAKYGPSGNLIWAKSVGGTGFDEVMDIAVDGSGNVYATGYFENTVDLNPGTGTTNVTSAGFYDIFVLKLDLSGNFNWGYRLGSTNIDYGHGIALDANANVHLTGQFRGTVDFDPGTGTASITSGTSGPDVYVSKWTSAGAYVWAKKMGGPNSDAGMAIVVDGSGNVYTTGKFMTTGDFDPGGGTSNLVSMGQEDVFVSKLNSSGAFVWAKSWGSASQEFAYDITLSGTNVITSGSFWNTVDFDPGAGTANIVSAGFDDGYISCLDASGNYVWAKAISGTSTQECRGLAVDGSGNIFMTANFGGSTDFDPNVGVYSLNSTGNYFDIAVGKYTATGVLDWVVSVGGSAHDTPQEIALDGAGNIYSVGAFGATVDFDFGSGAFPITAIGSFDAYVYKIKQCNPTSSTLTDVVCDSYTSPSGNYVWTTTGTYSDTLPNATGCDSLITVNLTVNHATTSTISPTACFRYTSPSGLNTWTTSGTYTDVIPNAAGCDSTITIQLTINTVNVNVNQNDSLLTATATGANYTWVDCNNGYQSVGGSAQTYIAPASGSFAVIITQNGCTDTSACYTVNLVAIEPPHAADIQLYPNPSNGNITLEFGDRAMEIRIVIRDMNGRELLLRHATLLDRISMNIPWPKGIYLLEATVDDGTVQRFLLQKQ